jgi:hypothetical protein
MARLLEQKKPSPLATARESRSSVHCCRCRNFLVCLALAALAYGAFSTWHGGTHKPVIPTEVLAPERWSAEATNFKKLITGELQKEDGEVKAELEKSRATNLRLSEKLASQTKEEARVTASLKREDDTLRSQLAEARRRDDRLDRQISQQKKRVSLAQLDAQNEHKGAMSWRQRAENLEKESSQEKVEVTVWHQIYSQSSLAFLASICLLAVAMAFRVKNKRSVTPPTELLG